MDSVIRAIGPGQFGLVLAPTKRGKSLFLAWVASAYVLQRLSVAYFTLEDSPDEVEDRLDSIITHIPLHSLVDKPNLLRRRFRRFQRLIKAQLKIFDGTSGGMSVPHMEQMLLRERDRGFRADAVIIDYDDEIVPTVKQKERRFEFADIYRDLRQMFSRHNQIGWTGAQTQRNTENLKVISGDRLAEDISKLRKVSLALSLGQGDWGPSSIYLYVAAHRHDTQHIGFNLMTDKRRMLIFDREATRKAEEENNPENED